MIGHEMGSVATPAPVATIDSPRAMITIRLCRSAKWLAEFSRHPDAPANIVPA
jgi:hypothetical protein